MTLRRITAFAVLGLFLATAHQSQALQPISRVPDTGSTLLLSIFAFGTLIALAPRARRQPKVKS